MNLRPASNRALVATLLVGGVFAVGSAACKKRSNAAVDAFQHDASVAQPRFGDPDDQRRLTFAIDAVHPGQKPTTKAPWHAPGGDWTFFDAHTPDGARFGFGMQEPKNVAKSPFAFSKGMLTVPNAEAGAKLVAALAKAFNGKAPAAAPRRELHIAPFTLALLGQNSGRDDRGFSGEGTWTATKLFLQRPGIEAEVFFNFDLAGRRGELAEKDTDYADDLVAFAAGELRDGREAARTEAD